jgi:hypothetical protein
MSPTLSCGRWGISDEGSKINGCHLVGATLVGSAEMASVVEVVLLQSSHS